MRNKSQLPSQFTQQFFQQSSNHAKYGRNGTCSSIRDKVCQQEENIQQHWKGSNAVKINGQLPHAMGKGHVTSEAKQKIEEINPKEKIPGMAAAESVDKLLDTTERNITLKQQEINVIPMDSQMVRIRTSLQPIY